MKQFSLLLLSLLLTICVYGQNSDTRRIAAFNKVKVSGAIDLYLNPGNSPEVRLEFSGVTAGDIITDVSGRELVIRLRKNNYGWRNVKIKAYVSYQQLEAIKASGACDVVAREQIKARRFTLETSGSSDVELLELQADTFYFASAGACDVQIAGKVGEQTVKMSGSGDYSALNLVSETCDLKISGSADVDVHVTEALYVRVSGSGDVRYRGNPSTSNLKVSGSGSARKIN